MLILLVGILLGNCFSLSNPHGLIPRKHEQVHCNQIWNTSWEFHSNTIQTIRHDYQQNHTFFQQLVTVSFFKSWFLVTLIIPWLLKPTVAHLLEGGEHNPSISEAVLLLINDHLWWFCVEKNMVSEQYWQYHRDITQSNFSKVQLASIINLLVTVGTTSCN